MTSHFRHPCLTSDELQVGDVVEMRVKSSYKLVQVMEKKRGGMMRRRAAQLSDDEGEEIDGLCLRIHFIGNARNDGWRVFDQQRFVPLNTYVLVASSARCYNEMTRLGLAHRIHPNGTRRGVPLPSSSSPSPAGQHEPVVKPEPPSSPVPVRPPVDAVMSSAAPLSSTSPLSSSSSSDPSADHSIFSPERDAELVRSVSLSMGLFNLRNALCDLPDAEQRKVLSQLQENAADMDVLRTLWTRLHDWQPQLGFKEPKDFSAEVARARGIRDDEQRKRLALECKQLHMDQMLDDMKRQQRRLQDELSRLQVGRTQLLTLRRWENQVLTTYDERRRKWPALLLEPRNAHGHPLLPQVDGHRIWHEQMAEKYAQLRERLVKENGGVELVGADGDYHTREACRCGRRADAVALPCKHFGVCYTCVLDSASWSTCRHCYRAVKELRPFRTYRAMTAAQLDTDVLAAS